MKGNLFSSKILMLIESNHWRVFLVTSRLVSIYIFRLEIMVNVIGSVVFAFAFVFLVHILIYFRNKRLGYALWMCVIIHPYEQRAPHPCRSISLVWFNHTVTFSALASCPRRHFGGSRTFAPEPITPVSKPNPTPNPNHECALTLKVSWW